LKCPASGCSTSGLVGFEKPTAQMSLGVSAEVALRFEFATLGLVTKLKPGRVAATAAVPECCAVGSDATAAAACDCGAW
jgi:hypothetical protein